MRSLSRSGNFSCKKMGLPLQIIWNQKVIARMLLQSIWTASLSIILKIQPGNKESISFQIWIMTSLLNITIFKKMVKKHHNIVLPPMKDKRLKRMWTLTIFLGIGIGEIIMAYHQSKTRVIVEVVGPSLLSVHLSHTWC